MIKVNYFIRRVNLTHAGASAGIAHKHAPDLIHDAGFTRVKSGIGPSAISV